MFRSEYNALLELERKRRRKEDINNEISTLNVLQAEPNLALAESEYIKLQLANLNKELVELDKPAPAPAAASPAIALFRHQPVPAKPNVIAPQSVVAKPLRVFTQDEIQKISEHYETLPDHLKEIMEAAIYDRYNLELIKQPVFLRNDSKIYDFEFLIKWLGNEDSKGIPEDQDKKFTKNDILPCNTLIKAMNILLDIIEGEENEFGASSSQAIVVPKNMARARISPVQLQLIEKIYYSLEPKRKALFDAICRDPKTNQIMDDPILLPDGYVYDRTTALFYLEKYQGRCPSNPNIFFQQKDILACCFVISVLDQLKEKANNLLQAKKAQAELPKKPIDNENLSNTRDQCLENIILLQTKIKKSLAEDNNSNQYNNDMDLVLTAAAQSLSQLNPDILEKAKKEHPRYNEVVTMFGGSKNSSSSTFGKFYRHVAVKIGTVNGQPGLLVGAEVKTAERLLEKIGVSSAPKAQY